MATHYKWYPGSEEVVVPWNARYSFPSQANKAVKTTPRIPPKNGATFSPGNTIRFEMPAQGYINTANTTLSFDVNLTGYNGSATAANNGPTWFQNNIQSIFNRVRLLYGATPLEDMINYNQIVRNLTEWTSSANGTFDQTSVCEGIGRVNTIAVNDNALTTHARATYIQMVFPTGAAAAVTVPTPGSAYNISTRRYQVQLSLGLLTQGKLLPSKFMASQLAIEITLEQPTSCIMALPVYLAGTVTGTPTYTVTNLNLIPEILEFDSSYDAMFLKGLQEGGVPLKFNTWHTFTFSQGGSTIANLQIQERSRSVKSIFTVIRRQTPQYYNDAGATFSGIATNSVLNYYQYRIGGRYFPAAPVICSNYQTSLNTPNGATEAYIELQKALNTLGDYRLSTSTNAITWGQKYMTTGVTSGPTTLQEADGTYGLLTTSTLNEIASAGNDLSATTVGNGCFCMAINLETTNGAEISGLNAEEQSDIALSCQWGAAPNAVSDFMLESYVLFDSMIILRPNNVLELIQ